MARMARMARMAGAFYSPPLNQCLDYGEYFYGEVFRRNRGGG